MQARQGLTAFIAAGMLLMAPAAAAETPPVRAMMEQSGMVEQFAGFGEEFGDGIRDWGPRQAGMPQEALEALAAIAERAMDGRRFLDSLEAVLTESLSAGEVGAVTRFYQSPLGTRLKHAEVAASDDDDEVLARIAELNAELAKDPARLAIARRIDEGAKGSELAASVVLGVLQAIAVGTEEGLQTGADPAAVRQRLAPMYGPLLAQMRTLTPAMFAHTYRDIPTADLMAYAAFLESGAAQAVNAAVFAALNEFLEMQGREIGREFAAYMKQKDT